MATCPSPGNPGFVKLKKVVSDNIAYALWNRNNGHPLDETPSGEPSILYRQLLDVYRNEDAALRAKANIYTDSFLEGNNWLATGEEPVFNNVEKEVNLHPNNPSNREFRRNAVGEVAESYTADPELESKLIGFLEGLNVTTEFKDELKEGSTYDAEALSDLVYKTVQVKKGAKIEDFAREAAYMAYSFLGRKNKIRTDLIHSIENLPAYNRVYQEYKERMPDYHPYKIKEMIIVDFLADAIINNYKAPKESYLQRDPEFWGIKGNSAIVKRMKYLLMKLKFFMQKVLNSSRLESREVEALMDDIANDVLNRNFSKFSKDLAEEQQLTNYEDTIARDEEAKELTEFVQSLGGILTGSLAIRKHGTLYRDIEKEELHDLDFSLPSELLSKEIEEAMGGIELPVNFFSLSKEEQDTAHSNAVSKAMTKITDKIEDFSIIKAIKKKYPQAYIANTFAGLNKGEYTVTLNVNDIAVDLFFVNDTAEDLGSDGFQKWQNIFKAKLKMGRAKDLRDFANFTPYYIRPGDLVAQHAGFRHFSFKEKSKRDAEQIAKKAYARQMRVLKSAMPFVKEVVFDENLATLGTLDPGGQTIRVNPKKMRDDTLAHEYGHLLIDLMGGMSNSFIAEGREQLRGSEAERMVKERYPELEGTEKFDKEVVATALGMEASKIFKEQEETERGSALTKFAKWLLSFFRQIKQLTGMSRNNTRILAQKLTSGKRIDTSKFTGQAADYAQEARDSIKTLPPEEEIEVIKKQSEKYSLTPDEKNYVFADTGELMERTSNLLGREGLSMTEEDAKAAPVVEWQPIGTFTHQQAENIANGKMEITPTDPNIGMTPEAFKQLQKIVKELFKDYYIAAEVKIGDPNIRVAGTMDIYAIHKKTGERVIFDYKTKKKWAIDKTTGAKVYNGFRFYDVAYGGKPYSQHAKNSAQLGLYKKMMQRTLGVTVDRLVVIPLVLDYDVNGTQYTIKSVELEQEHADGEIPMSPINKINDIYEAKAEEVLVRKQFEAEKKDGEELSDEELQRRIASARRLLKRKKMENPLSAKRIDSIKIIISRIARGRATKRAGEEQILASLLDTMLDENISDETAIIDFLFNAVNTIKDIHIRLKALEEREANGDADAFTLEELHRWYIQLEAYNLLDEFVTMIDNDVLKGANKENKEDLKHLQEILGDAIKQRNNIMYKFKTKGKELLTSDIAPYLTLIKETVMAEARKEWMANNVDKQKSMKKKEWMAEMDVYVQEMLAKNQDDIIARTKAELLLQMKEATNGDISSLERWLESPVNSNDPLVAAMVSKITVAYHRIRKESKEIERDLVTLVKDLEKYYGYTTSMDPRKLYDFMLEHVDGEPNGYILTKFSGKLITTMYRMLDSTKSMPARKKFKVREKWFEENMPLKINEFNEGFQKYVDDLVKSGDLSKNEAIMARDGFNVRGGYYKTVPAVSAHANILLTNWVNDNKMDYRKPSSKWVTKEYLALEEILKDKNDPRTKFYNKIMDITASLDNVLPQDARLYGQLPFVLKSTAERRAAGQSIGSIAKAGMEKTFRRVADDQNMEAPIATRITDESDNIIDLVPNYFKRQNKNYKIEDQSFDLGTMFAMWSKMATHYKEMSEIQPQIEATRTFLKERKYAEVDKKGNRVMKTMDALGNIELARENKNSQILNQFEDYVKVLVYGQASVDEGNIEVFGITLDKSKALGALSKYTAISLLGLNVQQAINNVNFGEISNIIEGFAGEHFDLHDMKEATKVYWNNFMPIINDIGERRPEGFISMLVEEFDPLSDASITEMRKNTLFSQLMSSSTTFFLSHAGEHFMQVRVLMAMLNRAKAYDSEGKELGSMLEMYTKHWADTGKYGVPKEVDLKKSAWSKDERSLFTERVKFVLAGIHGEYSPTGINAIQRYALGKMAIMFRKFIVPGITKRFGGKRFNQRGSTFTEGYYRVGYKFFSNLYKEMKTMGFESAANGWYKMDISERAALRRMAAEASFFMILTILFTALTSVAGDLDEDKDAYLLQAVNMARYVALRSSQELVFFISPMDAISILRSPAASISSLENTAKFAKRIATFNAFEKYETPDLYEYKIEKDFINMIPIVRQWYRLQSVDDVIDLMQM